MGNCLHSTSAVKSELCCHSPSVKQEQHAISKKMYLVFKTGQQTFSPDKTIDNHQCRDHSVTAKTRFLCQAAAPWRRTLQNPHVQNHSESPAGSLGLCNNSWGFTLALRQCQRAAGKFGDLKNTTASWLYAAAWDPDILECCPVMTGALVCFPPRGKRCPPASCGIWPPTTYAETGAPEMSALFLSSACTAILKVPLLTIHSNWVPKYFTPW